MNEIFVNGEILKVLFMFSNNSKNYVVYVDKNNEISASIINVSKTNIELLPIESDEEWDLVQQKIDEKESLYGEDSN